MTRSQETSAPADLLGYIRAEPAFPREASRERAMNEGRIAGRLAMDGKPQTGNPYRSWDNPDEHGWWEDGYEIAVKETAMPGPASDSFPGPSEEIPHVASWQYPNGARLEAGTVGNESTCTCGAEERGTEHDMSCRAFQLYMCRESHHD